jgi:hypothetical protein
MAREVADLIFAVFRAFPPERADEPPAVNKARAWVRKSIEKARDICIEVTLRFPRRGNLARFTPRSPLCGTLPARRSYGLLRIHPEPGEKKNRSEVAGLRSKAAGVPRGMAPSQRHLKDFDLITLIPPTPLGNQGGKMSVSLSRSEAGSEATVGRGKAKLSPSKKPMWEPSGLTNHIPLAFLARRLLSQK